MKRFFTISVFYWTVCLSGAWSQQPFIRYYDATEKEAIISVVPARDGGYYLGGQTSTSVPGSEDFLLIKINSSGAEEWKRIFGGYAEDYFGQIIMGNDGYIYLAGSRYDSITHFDVVLLKISEGGYAEWEKKYDHSVVDLAQTLTQGTDGFLYAAGYSDSLGQVGLIIKTDTEGNKIWSRDYSFCEEIRDIVPLSNDRFLVFGQKDFFFPDQTSLFRIDSAGFADADIVVSESFDTDVKAEWGHDGTLIWNSENNLVVLDTATLTIKDLVPLKNHDGWSFQIPAADDYFMIENYYPLMWDYFFYRLHPNGETEWERLYQLLSKEVIFDAIQLSGGGYAVCGSVEDVSRPHGQSGFLMVVDCEANLETVTRPCQPASSFLDIQVYPTVTDGIFFFDVKGNPSRLPLKLEVFDLAGKLVLQSQVIDVGRYEIQSPGVTGFFCWRVLAGNEVQVSGKAIWD